MNGSAAPLAREIAVIEARLALAVARQEGTESDLNGTETALNAAEEAASIGGPARKLGERLGLTPFARDCLLLAAAPHLSPRIAPLCARLTGDPQGRVTAALAMAVLPGAAWSALRPDAPLRALRCLRLADPDRPTLCELIVDERVLLALMGEDALDERLAPLVRPVMAQAALGPSAQDLAERLVERWWAMRGAGETPAIRLHHRDGDGADAGLVAQAVAARLGRRLMTLSPANLPPTPAERHGFAALWRREALLGALALLVELPEDASPEQAALAADLVDRIDDVVIVIGGGSGGALPCRRPLAAATLDVPGAPERHALWTRALGQTQAARLNGATEALASQFAIGPVAIARLGALATGLERDEARALLSREARAHAQARIAAVAEVIHPVAGWDDIVLPAELKSVLRAIAAQVRHRARVHEDWGFATRGSRGLGIAALFAGSSGTGKTMAAEVIAADLGTDVVRVDLAGLVSKYIGETEKNLSRVFAAAEGSGAVLLFDEADALFGKRSEVSNAHDRYANIEVSYLLQRMESYTGLAILTTNQREALDAAFFRRLRFVLAFPFPDEALRRAVWRHAFPQATPTQGLDFDSLARLNVAPGNIRSIAVNAAFLAAAQGEVVAMRHLHEAAVLECRKLERPVTAAELGGWL